ncbi:Uncharacterised protein [Yersinia enterocolitica]|nr:Uncharacterised protein [Yersinia enterocolitica]
MHCLMAEEQLVGNGFDTDAIDQQLENFFFAGSQYRQLLWLLWHMP